MADWSNTVGNNASTDKMPSLDELIELMDSLKPVDTGFDMAVLKTSMAERLRGISEERDIDCLCGVPLVTSDAKFYRERIARAAAMRNGTRVLMQTENDEFVIIDGRRLNAMVKPFSPSLSPVFYGDY